MDSPGFDLFRMLCLPKQFVHHFHASTLKVQ